MKAKREWCRVTATQVKRTDKKRVRCQHCGRLLKVETPDEYDGDIQFIAAHKGKFNAKRQPQRATRTNKSGESRQVYSVRANQGSRKAG